MVPSSNMWISRVKPKFCGNVAAVNSVTLVRLPMVVTWPSIDRKMSANFWTMENF